MRSSSLVVGVALVLLAAGCGQTSRPHPARPDAARPEATQPTRPERLTPAAAAPSAKSPPLRFTALHMLTASVGWGVLQVGRRPSQPRWPVVRTTDGGRRWVDVSPWAGAGRRGPPGAGLATDFQTADEAWVAVPEQTPAKLAVCGAHGPSLLHPCLGPQGVIRYRDSGGAVVDHFPGVTVYHTTDGGRTWTGTQVDTLGPGFPYPGPVSPLALSFSDPAHGWLMVQPEHGMGSEPGELLATADGGFTWEPVATTNRSGGTRGSLPFGGRIAFVSATTGWLAGGLVSTVRDLLYVTHDAGRTWQAVRLPVPEGHTRQQMMIAPPTLSGEQGVLPVWFQGRAASDLYVSSDGGASWRYTRPVPGAPPEVPSIHDAVAVDGETLYRTTDGGRSWTATQAGGDLPLLLARRGTGIGGADFVGARAGWIFGTEPARPVTRKSQWATTPMLPFLVHTTDGGRTWSRLSPVLLGDRTPQAN